MSRNKEKFSSADLPSTGQLEAELNRITYAKNYRTVLRSTIYTLITVAAVAVLVAVLLLPTLTEEDIVVSVKSSDFKTGDIIAFYYNNKILVKRVIANPGDWVDIDKDGNVYVNNQAIEEPYLDVKAFGDCNIKLPYQVPESRIFVMGDNRDVSVDSRNTSVGCVAEEQIVGKIVFCIWPFSRFGKIQ